jgi:exopolyphosphatase/guanosine-5'-triphosphate,3'-diphosphate pyrophosphatase
MYAIGGSATRLAAIKHGIKTYTPELTDGTVITLDEVANLSDKLLNLPVSEIKETTICGASSDVIGGGCLLIYKIMVKLGLSYITVSEKDNLEGYALFRCGNVPLNGDQR